MWKHWSIIRNFPWFNKDKVIVSDLISDLHRAIASKQVRNTLREKFYIVSDGARVRSVVNNCVACQEKFKRLVEQKMVPLLAERI